MIMSNYRVNINNLFWMSFLCLIISLTFKLVMEIKLYPQIINSCYQILKVPLISIQFLLLVLSFILMTSNSQKSRLKYLSIIILCCSFLLKAL